MSVCALSGFMKLISTTLSKTSSILHKHRTRGVLKYLKSIGSVRASEHVTHSPLTHSLTHSLTSHHSLTHSLTHSRTTHSLTHSHTHTLTHSPLCKSYSQISSVGRKTSRSATDCRETHSFITLHTKHLTSARRSTAFKISETSPKQTFGHMNYCYIFVCVL